MKTELLILLIDFSIALIILTSKYFTKIIMATKTHEMKKHGTEENKNRCVGLQTSKTRFFRVTDIR